MLKRFIILLAVLTGFFLAHAHPVISAENSLMGKFTFNWYVEPSKTRCARIGHALMAKLSSAKFHCDFTPHTNTASGAAASLCSSTDGNSEYMIFSTLAACENEHETQAANEE